MAKKYEPEDQTGRVCSTRSRIQHQRFSNMCRFRPFSNRNGQVFIIASSDELEAGGGALEAMANQGAKKRKEENTKHMTNLRRLIIASNVRQSPQPLLLFCFPLCPFYSFIDLIFYIGRKFVALKQLWIPA